MGTAPRAARTPNISHSKTVITRRTPVPATQR